MAGGEHEYPTRIFIEEDESSSPSSNAFISPQRRCCFSLPCFGPQPTEALHNGPPSSSTTSLWERIRAVESEGRWWAGPLRALVKLREWSEIVAGPKWKTFIRRFNRNRNRHHHQTNTTTGKFQYDPLSYALNFDEGHGQNGHFDEEYDNFPDFSSRFAAVVPLSSKSSMDLGTAG